MLVRGARLARDEELFLSGPESDVTQFEKDALKREKSSTVWQQSKEMKIILLTCCVAAIAQGWDQASITGANLLWPSEMDLKVNLAEEDVRTRDVWIFGGVNAITYFAACSIGAWISDPLNEHFWGRRGALFVAGLFSFAGVVGCAFCQNWQTLFVCRMLVGIGELGSRNNVCYSRWVEDLYTSETSLESNVEAVSRVNISRILGSSPEPLFNRFN